MLYAALWTLWLGVVPHGLWSERIAVPSMEEFDRRVAQLEVVFDRAVAHFGLTTREGATIADLASGAASLIEGSGSTNAWERSTHAIPPRRSPRRSFAPDECSGAEQWNRPRPSRPGLAPVTRRHGRKAAIRRQTDESPLPGREKTGSFRPRICSAETSD